MRERVQVFGSQGGLVGVLTEPDPGREREGAPALVVSNVGLNHRPGPNRLYVDLARSLAARGFSTLRFDLSGLGDSAPRRDAPSDLGRAVLDVSEAMDHLAHKRGARSFALMGICSGTDSTHTLATTDPRVSAAIFVDGYAYTTPLSTLHHYTLRNLEPGRWRRFARRFYEQRVARRAQAREPGEASEVYDRAYPTLEQFRADVARMSARGCESLFVYTGAWNYAYLGQFDDMTRGVDLAGRVRVEHFPRADHTFTAMNERARLFDTLGGWLEARFPAREAAARHSG